jgi:hypothetical protein
MPFQIKCEDQVSRKLGTVLSQLCFRSERVTSLSMLTLIYRSIPPDKPGGSVFCDECIATARQAVKEHEKCVEIFTSTEKQSNYFLLYVNWYVLTLVDGSRFANSAVKDASPIPIHPLYRLVLSHDRDI